MMQDAAAVAAAERIKAQAGARVHRLGQPEELKEDAMPKPKAEPAKKPADEPQPVAKKRKYVRRAPAAGEGAARFGVFDDGSVKISLPGCAGTLGPEEAREFVGFLKRIGVKV